MNIKFFSNLQIAADNVINKYQNKENVIVLPYAPHIIPHLVE